ncbi:MAG: hypothetical protein J1F39_02030 [Clostridiales bacterium]|nr:hypothetical protein [Clostridiales bacterium]
MPVSEKIPIIVGVTGHRNIAEADKPEIKKRIIESLEEIKKLCESKSGGEDTPIVMLNAFAQGADTLCAEAAFDLGIDVYAVLPRPEDEYINSFDDGDDKKNLLSNLAKTKRRFVAPDIEQCRDFMKLSRENYEYRQTGIYIAEHSHILLALWDGKSPSEQYGCGTVEVIKFALAHNYLDHDGMFKPGAVNDSAAVIYINARREGQPEREIKKQWMIAHVPTVKEKEGHREFLNKKAKNADEDTEVNFEKKPDPENNYPVPADKAENRDRKEIKITLEPKEDDDSAAQQACSDVKEEKDVTKLVYYTFSEKPPEYIQTLIAQTVEYNNLSCGVKEEKIIQKLWIDDGKTTELDEYRKSLCYHYAKTDYLSYSVHQAAYSRILFIIAILGTAVALFFLIYDDAALPFMIIPCTAAIVAIIIMLRIGRQRGYHKYYTVYRTFAEALRIQFYLSSCIDEEITITNVCDLCPWTQKVGILWIHKAIQALAVVNETHKLNIDADKIMFVWLERNNKGIGGPEGQENYHSRKLPPNKKTSELHKKLSDIFKYIAIGLYALVLGLEIVTYICHAFNYSLFWENIAFAHIAWRNIGAIILGIGTAASLLLSSYWGKLSFDRKTDDNVRMLRFYSAAVTRWEDAIDRTPREKEKFFKEIAREEIIENGNWCSYVNENGLELNI